MFHDFGRLAALALATLGAVAAGCSSTAEFSSGRRNESAYPPERLLAIAEVFEKQGNTARAGDLYGYIRQSSPELAQDAENHLRLMAQGISRSGLEGRDQFVAQGAAPKTAPSTAVGSKAVARAQAKSAVPNAVARTRPQSAAPRTVSQPSPQNPQSQASGQPYRLVGYRRPAPSSNAGLTTADMIDPDKPREKEEPAEFGEMRRVTPAEPLHDAQDLEDAAGSAEAVRESAEPADAMDVPVSTDAPVSQEAAELEGMRGKQESQPSDGIEEDGGPMDEDDEPPAISEGAEGASQDAAGRDSQEDPADESIPGIDEVLRDLKSADPDRRLVAALRIARLETDVAPIVRSLRQSMHHATSQVVQVQLADAILLISPYELEVVRFLLQVEKSEDRAAAELAHELLDSLIDGLVWSHSAMRRPEGKSDALVAEAPAVAPREGEVDRRGSNVSTPAERFFVNGCQNWN